MVFHLHRPFPGICRQNAAGRAPVIEIGTLVPVTRLLPSAAACGKTWSTMKKGPIAFLLAALSLSGISLAAELPRLQPVRIVTEPKEGWRIFFGGCSWYCGAPKIVVSATSFLTESASLKHPPQQAHDSNMAKVWSEGVEGNGTGEMLSFTFITTEKDTTDLGVTSCAIATGHQGSNKLFRQNARPRTLELVVDGRTVAKLELQDVMGLQWFEIPKVKLARPSKHVIALKIGEVYPGSKFQDCCISEVYFQGTGQMH